MRLVDEQDDRLRAVAHGVDHALEALLELALHAGAGLQQAEVEHPQDHLPATTAALRRRRCAGPALDHRGLADAWRADQDRVVLPPAQEDVDALADLPVAPDYGSMRPARASAVRSWVYWSSSGSGALRLVAACRRAVRRGRLFAGGLDPLQQVGLQGLVGIRSSDDALFSSRARRSLAVEQGEQQQAGTDLRLAEHAGVDHGVLEQADGVRGQRRSAGIAGLEQLQRQVDLGDCGRRAPGRSAAAGGEVAAVDVQQLQQQVLDLYVMMGAR